MDNDKIVGSANKSIFFIIISLVVITIAGTFAWLNWRSKDTAMVFTAGDVDGLFVTLTPYQINATLNPVSDYTDGIVIDVTADNKGTTSDVFKLFYQINAIDNALIDEGFKYTITKCTANCNTPTNYQVLTDATGDFSTATAGDPLDIYIENIPANTTYKYKVYLWIDSSSGNQSNMQNKVFKGELRAFVRFDSLYNTITAPAVMDNTSSTYVTSSTGINFGTVSSNTNGKGIYIRTGTQNNEYPIYYYRGAVTDNNVFFGGFCWKMVRTTPTGGIKMIYNGTKKAEYIQILHPESDFTIVNDSTYPFSYDSNEKTWTSTMHSHSTTAEMTLTFQSPGDYILNYTVSSETCCDKAYFFKNNVALGNSSGITGEGQISLDGIVASDVIKVQYKKDGSTSSGSDNVVFSIGSQSDDTTYTCNNNGADSTIGQSYYNSSTSTLDRVGYMHSNTASMMLYRNVSSNSDVYLYGNSYNYQNGTYTLVNTKSFAGTSWSSNYNQLNYYHYTCLNTTGTCSSLYYIYYTSTSSMYVTTLTNNKSVDTLLTEQFSTHTTNSTAKTTIDTWYAANMTNYTDKLEDTPYCNDRTIYTKNGWDPNGGNTTSSYMYFNGYNRISNTKIPSLACSVTDSFTKNASNGNGSLQYPVGLLSTDEVMLAGFSSGYTATTSYLANGTSNMTMTPVYVTYSGTKYYYTYNSYFSSTTVNTNSYVRPVISLKNGARIISGTGTGTDPYVIE